MNQYWWMFLTWFYNNIRFLVVSDWDELEDYKCEYCGKPVLRRFIYCSVRCNQEQEREWDTDHE